jgi:hypothetical protein
MKESVKLEQIFIKMIDRVIINLPAVERQMFLQFHKKK